MKTFREIAEMHYAPEPSNEFDKQYRENRINALEKLLTEQLRIHSVSNSIATEYAEFCVRCDREKLPLLCLEDYIKQYCS